MKKTIACFLLAAFLVSSAVAAEGLRTTQNLRDQDVILPFSTPERGRMAELQRLTFIDDDLGAGLLVFYDDPRTKWAIDYVELYDVQGDLLVVSWIDMFGACQGAIDRGLLDEDDPKIEGVLVTIDVGTML